MFGPMRLFFYLFFIFYNLPSFAISEVNYHQVMTSEVLPFLKKNLKKDTFISDDGVRISYSLLSVESSKGTVILSPGRTESSISSSEIIYDLMKQNYSVAVIDHRGQGESDRLVVGSDVGHVESFYDYVKDMSFFVNEIVFKKMRGPYFMWANSMGAPIALQYLIDNPDKIESLAMTAPLLRIQFRVLPESLTKWLLSLMTRFMDTEEYIIGGYPYNYKISYVGNYVTHSPERFNFDVFQTNQHRSLAVGSPSLGWVNTMMDATVRLRSEAANIKTPILILQAQQDYYVNNDAQEKFCKLVQNCSLVSFEKAYHWIIMESDKIRTPMIEKISSFFNITGSNQIAKKIESLSTNSNPHSI